MSEQFIPEYVDPFRLAEQGIRLKGTVHLCHMQRLHTSLNTNDHPVKVDLQFGIDEQKITFLRGRVEARITLQCQRCMEPFFYEMASDFSLGIVNTLDEANRLPECYEPALVQEGSLAVREVIEDELILSLPIIPKHSPENCSVTLPLTDSGWEQDQMNNPFRVLESLKYKQSK
jgi:uncharacterized protein